MADSSTFTWNKTDYSTSLNADRNWFTGSNWAGRVSPGLGGSSAGNPETVVIAQGSALVSSLYAGAPSSITLNNLTIDVGQASSVNVPRFAIGNASLGSGVSIDSTANPGYYGTFRAYGVVNFAGTVTSESAGGTFTVNVQNAKAAAGGQAGLLNNSGTITATNSSTLNINGGINNTGSIVADGATIDFTPPSGASATSLSGSGSLMVENGGTIAFSPFDQIASGETVTFGGGLNNTLSVDANDQIAGQLNIGDFQQNDTIDLTSFADGATSSYSDGVLTVTDDTHTISLDFATGSAAPVVAQLGNGTVEVTAACFRPGTLLLTEHGERAVEDIAIGDRLITASGDSRPVKWVGHRFHSAEVARGAPHVAPILIRQGALDDDLPRRDLYVSPGHAMYLDGMLINAADLVNGVSVLRCPVTGDVRYINVEFEQHEVIYAEGSPTESFCCTGDNRQMYDNWREYLALYPQDDPDERKPYYAPRLVCGFAVEAVRQRIDARAGIKRAPDQAPGRLKGWVHEVNTRMVSGWATDTAAPGEPVVLELLIDGRVLGEVIANHYRPWHAANGHPTGRCGFQIELPADLSPYERHTIQLRRAADGAELDGSPCLLEAAVSFEGGGERQLAAALARATGNADTAAGRDQAIAFLSVQMDRLLQARADLSGGRAQRAAPYARRGRSVPRPAARMEAGAHVAASRTAA